jgi:hypothetical protein
MGIDLSGIQHEYEMRGAHADAVGLASDDTLARPNGLLKGDIYSVIRAFDLENDILEDDYLLVSNFTKHALLAKVRTEKLRSVDILNHYYPTLFAVLHDYTKISEMTMLDVVKSVADGRLDLQRDIFPHVLNGRF